MRGRLRGKLNGLALAVFLLPVPAAVGACGGSNQAAKSADNAAATGSTSAPAPVVNGAGQQVGVLPGDDGLTGAAKDAYDRGFQAWVSGDLAGAKSAFLDASSKAPKAGGPKYSLG